MSDDALAELAEAAGISVRWRDAFGRHHDVQPDTLRQVLEALGLPANSPDQIRNAIAECRRPPSTLPPLVTADAGHRVILPSGAAPYKLQLEDGRCFEGHADQSYGGCIIPPILEPGYHALILGDQQTRIAVAPQRCVTLHDLVPGGRAFGIAVQLYSLRRQGDGGIGDFTALAQFAASAGRYGATCVAISPVHAQFSSDIHRFAPYAPSSRVALNVMHATADGDPAWEQSVRGLEDAPLIDWVAASDARLARFGTLFHDVRNDPARMEEFGRFRTEQGEGLQNHAVFEALHARLFHHAPRIWNWREWPEQYRSPGRPEVAEFAREHERQVDFYAFLQFLAHEGLAKAQRAAREAGLSVGLIADLAVGTDAGGSHCWSRQGETLAGLTIGAPPDLIQMEGQNWGLAAFSPRGLIHNGFTAFLEMLRASLAYAGGVRIDHAMGLHRMWVIPEGAGALDGAYLHYPETDLLRLIALESVRHRALIVAEDLGTLPEGFQERLRDRGLAGMRVLYFERDEQGFRPPSTWDRGAVAMTSTHDLPTVAGWWIGEDINWREKLNHAKPDEIAASRAERAEDRGKLWHAMQRSGAAEGPVPSPETTECVVDAAIAHVTGSACDLLILPVEDIIGLCEQPNLPNTTDEHPNWRRRLPGPASEILDHPEAARRLHRAASGRGRP